jgi:hypothetical protein
MMFDSCVYHVVSAGHQILKLALNVEIFFFLFAAGSKKRMNPYASFVIKSPKLFYIFKDLQITFHYNKNHSIFNIQRPVQMT